MRIHSHGDASLEGGGAFLRDGLFAVMGEGFVDLLVGAEVEDLG
jgi:hypothetical protein